MIADSDDKAGDGIELRNVGLKATAPRVRVLSIIRQNEPHHMSAEDVLRRLIEEHSDISMSTVYRVLADMEAAGLVVRHVFEGGSAVYEINKGEHHDHLICLGCGRIDEFSNEAIENLQMDVARGHGYALADHRLALYGYCPACATPKRATPHARLSRP